MKVAIVGAGCSGLTAIKACLEEGLDPVCFEAHSDIGGLWRYTEDAENEKGSIYASCVINTCKEMMAFSDFPVPDEFPNAMPHSKVLEYFRMYAKKFDLERHIHFRHRVEFISLVEPEDQSQGWLVKTRNERDETKTEVFEAVLICNGHHSTPYKPDLPGLETFGGEVLHSHDYRRFDKFRNKRVLVVGIGNSAVDIAVDVCSHARETTISTRHGAWIFNRLGFFGLPMDAIANSRLVFAMPRRALVWLLEQWCNFLFDHRIYGLNPDHRPLCAHPTINDALPHHMSTGRITVGPDVQEFTENGVRLSDGRILELDTVILATGYNYRLPFLDPQVLEIAENKVDLYKFTFPIGLGRQPKLAVIGLVQAIGAVMPIAEMQCRWATRVFKGLSELPEKGKMKASIENIQNENSDYIPSRRHTLQTTWIQIMDSLATEVGCRPRFGRLLFEDFRLAVTCYVGPCLPAQFRLHGPGIWPSAAATIRTAMSRMRAPTKGKDADKEQDFSIFFPFRTIICMSAFVTILSLLVLFY